MQPQRQLLGKPAKGKPAKGKMATPPLRQLIISKVATILGLKLLLACSTYSHREMLIFPPLLLTFLQHFSLLFILLVFTATPPYSHFNCHFFHICYFTYPTAALNCLQLQLKCKMCAKVSDRYLMAATVATAVATARNDMTEMPIFMLPICWEVCTWPRLEVQWGGN